MTEKSQVGLALVEVLVVAEHKVVAPAGVEQEVVAVVAEVEDLPPQERDSELRIIA